ncbi:MAG: hypothetical protein GXX86_10885 [Propionibacterium sp.]|nr:hypothetical protein [Propionibacterium sp.]
MSDPDEFEEFNGWHPDVRRSEIEEFDLIDAEILLDGDGSGHGYHRFGSGKRKSEFPEGLSCEGARFMLPACCPTA